MERVIVKIDIYHAVSGKGREIREHLSHTYAHHCRNSNDGYDCTAGIMPCPFSGTSCGAVTPDDWLKVMEVEE